MFVIRNIKTPDTWSDDDWNDYVFDRLEHFLDENNITGDITQYKVTAHVHTEKD